MALDLKGIAVSSGSACSSGKGEPSHVLLGMGLPREVAFGAVRVSLGRDNTEAEIDRLLEVLAALRSQVA
jgi:cysteine desulfurase